MGNASSITKKDLTLKIIYLIFCVLLTFNLSAEERLLNYDDVPQEILKKIKKGSIHTVTQMKSQGVSHFEYNEDSVKFLSDVITDERLQLSEEAKRSLPEVWGAYLGDVLIRKLGGKWVKLGDHYGVLIGKSHISFPLDKVHKHIVNGDIDSIYGFYLTTVKTANNLASAESSAKNAKPETSKLLEQLALELNKKAPLRVSPTLTVVRVSSQKGELTYHYKSLQSDINTFAIDRFVKDRTKELTAKVCNEESQSLFRDNKVIVNYEYMDKNDKHLATIRINAGKCK